MDVLKKVPVREQEPLVRAKNFEEVCLGYDEKEAVDEAERCLNCKNAQCVKGCPVSIDIPGFVSEVKNKNFEKAYEIISESSALPAVCGRVCPQESQCEGKCIRGFKGEPVSIGKLERFTADWARKNGIVPKAPEHKNGRKVAVIGSGPAGLTCAGDLARMGYDVTIFEALHEAGGVLIYGIPEFRLPKQDVVAKEVENVKALGVKIETNVVIGKSTTIDELMEEEGFEAVFIGSGAGLPRFMGIPGEQANGVFSANEFLTRNNLMKAFKEEYDTPIMKGKKVYVLDEGIEYKKYKDTAPKALYKKFMSFEDEICKFGVEIIKDLNVITKNKLNIKKELESTRGSKKKDTKVLDKDVLNLTSVESVKIDNEFSLDLRNKKLISEADLRKPTINGVKNILVNKKSIITPLAVDFMRIHHLKLKKL